MPTFDKDPHTNSIVLTQKLIRGKLARRKYGFKQASSQDLTAYEAFLVGNDPKINLPAEHQTSKGKIALVGTSGLRSLALLCELGNKENTPKLILVDNSKPVITFWRNLRQFAESHTSLHKNDFIVAFQDFLAKNQDLFHDIPEQAYNELNLPNVVYENQNPIIFMETLIDQHGMNYVLSIIKHATIIGQTWADKQLFTALKNIIDLNEIDKVYAYPSNITACIPIEEAEKVMENIQHLEPAVTIITDRCPNHGVPEHVSLLKPGEQQANFFQKQQPYVNPYQDKYNAVRRILGTFQTKIDTIGRHYPPAKKVAQKLHEQLENDLLRTTFNQPTAQGIQEFASRVKATIASVSSELQRDLGWGDYLCNLAKRIINVLTYGLRCGQYQGFFVKPSDAVQWANDMDEDLQNLGLGAST